MGARETRPNPVLIACDVPGHRRRGIHPPRLVMGGPYEAHGVGAIREVVNVRSYGSGPKEARLKSTTLQGTRDHKSPAEQVLFWEAMDKCLKRPLEQSDVSILTERDEDGTESESDPSDMEGRAHTVAQCSSKDRVERLSVIFYGPPTRQLVEGWQHTPPISP